MMRNTTKKKKYPAPAVVPRANYNVGDSTNPHQQQSPSRPTAGTLPEGAAEISNAAKALLMRLLERDPKVRMRNLRQLQQSAFYMGFNLEHVKAKKVNPRSLIEQYFPENKVESSSNHPELMNAIVESFDQSLNY